MKRSLFRLLTTCFSIIAIALFAGSVFAQGSGNGGGKGNGNGGGGGEDPPTSPFNYRLEYASIPSGATRSALYQVREVNGGTIALGSYKMDGLTHGFIYDHSTQIFTDVFDKFGFESSCRAINANGVVVGNVINQAGMRRVYWFDYSATTPTINFLDDQFPVLTGLQRINAADINVHGDIVINDGPNGNHFVLIHSPAIRTHSTFSFR